ncbi:MAG: MotA/TolQ/ExbB proton channel family protein [Epsilonproteobacteria bacterium]|nr:MotA/TolQ/ExbB proton channel family protein [Campylobacterota bacterium]OIO14382.1 MAG: flagellar motor protein MotA [Helicobacteraceae bacterium CG1_02_36_14]PIP10757.1 MAG: flagellar motor protein MotA [Sulfurimonas sp. CG23_combo_of_CG06-09_8_20_14_all_36_33]PIS24218.1 MAG: MotA/TolQ/ExbB proton channel family protein [Sulfurimonas sp. CG08_land_8_20_14_0_20_36_33]PIU36023.1 MAG: MotA/TolQ/ExbB proton channel family protein [Sulfurimonas sp. CG07_land_8_20_14_0_80_36_56]PIV04368.1 MAG: 
MINEIVDFYLKSHPVTLGVLVVLSVYFIVLNWVFFYRLFYLNEWLLKEESSLEALLLGAETVNQQSFLNNFIKSSSNVSKEILDLGMLAATKEATKGLSILSVFASTTPFIGLFGTVVSILDTFTHIGQSSGSMSIISSGVSDALIATASGIFVAIFAYTYHQMLKRKSFEVVGFLKMQSDAILARKQ